MAKAIWTETSHTTGWFILKTGRKEIAHVMRVEPKKTKRGYAYKYMDVKRFGCANGLPGMFGNVFKTKREAFASAERRAGV